MNLNETEVADCQHHAVGILLAAGRSRRMGRDKALLAWPSAHGQSTLIETSFNVIAPFVDHVVVVYGEASSAISDSLARHANHDAVNAGAGKFSLVAGAPQGDMFESIRCGLQAALQHQRRTIVLHPVDVPLVRAATVSQVISEHQRSGRVVMPEYDGRGGHPVAMPASIVDDIMTWQGSGGLRQFWVDHATQCMRLPVNDAAVVTDLDTPEEYESAFATAQSALLQR